ncbi:hypothetical protein [Ruegeria arenilitoris]|uniref:hypothetical protein n=1 Tax=Ruegeria arenilitoris TaxID=1173585 RepID=UPI0014814735|nr:hypothetical protein [Ruegeria arenilitoris]
MNITYLMWLFAALFVVTGLPLALTENEQWQRLWGGTSALSLGLFAISMATDGLLRGQIRIHFSIIRRSSQPRLFFCAVALVLAAGTGVIIAAIWVIFFKD